MIPPFTAVPALPILPPITRNHGNHNEKKWLSIRTLLVVTTGNLEEVTLELIAESVTGNLIEKPISPIALMFRDV